MKISIYELLGKMKDFEAPNKIIYDTKLWTYNGNDYEDENNWELFDEYVLLDILNDEVTILETTITIDGKTINLEELKPAFNCPVGEKGESVFDNIKKISQEDIETYNGVQECSEVNNKIEKLSYQQIGSWALEQHNWVDYARAVDKQIQQIGSKINKIIDRLNKDQI